MEFLILSLQLKILPGLSLVRLPWTAHLGQECPILLYMHWTRMSFSFHVKTLWLPPVTGRTGVGSQGSNSRCSLHGNSTGAFPLPRGAASASLSSQIPRTEHRESNRNMEIPHTGSLWCSGLNFGFMMLKGGCGGVFLSLLFVLVTTALVALTVTTCCH